MANALTADSLGRGMLDTMAVCVAHTYHQIRASHAVSMTAVLCSRMRANLISSGTRREPRERAAPTGQLEARLEVEMQRQRADAGCRGRTDNCD